MALKFHVSLFQDKENYNEHWTNKIISCLISLKASFCVQCMHDFSEHFIMNHITRKHGQCPCTMTISMPHMFFLHNECKYSDPFVGIPILVSK